MKKAVIFVVLLLLVISSFSVLAQEENSCSGFWVEK